MRSIAVAALGLLLAGCQQPASSNNYRSPIQSVGAVGSDYRPLSPDNKSGKTTYFGFFDGGTASMEVTPAAAGKSHFDLMGSGRGDAVCAFRAQGDAPAEAKTVALSSRSRGDIEVTLFRKGTGWSFRANQHLPNTSCTFEGDLKPG